MRITYLLVLLLCSQSILANDKVRELAWEDLMPPGARAAAEPPVPLHDLSTLADVLSAEMARPAAQQLPNAPVVPELNGQYIKLPGYIVPLNMLDDGRVTDFLLVPYFGACIHVPPPPSNQIVFVRYPQGIAMNALYDPFWVQGPLKVENASSELAEAGYQMLAEQVFLYQ